MVTEAELLDLTDPDGFLVDPNLWSEALAQSLVDRIGIRLDERHFEIIRFIRFYNATYHHLPNNRMFIKAVGSQLGPDKGSSLYLNLLFMGQPVRNACLAAGLPKPPGCL